MPNDYFDFKQFRIEQSACAMKVSTDACLLGAATDLTSATHLLDIGTGTGLLALMAAQRHPSVEIEAVEIDSAAAAQAAANVAASPWAHRMRVHAVGLADYAATQPASFSHIICNPPFFRESLPSADLARNNARHVSAASLSFEELAQFAAQFLLPSGSLTVLLPPPEMAWFEQAAQAVGLSAATRLSIRHRPGARVTRHITRFERGAAACAEKELVIHAGATPGYSSEFRALLTGFYLAL
ncbi:methyltransferase [Hymenobacter sp. BT770]|uniref:tRNA1(Val) (adenine(37)-N6)-methyltransferase n=1 Tax=Hymenobacter sp. BT770 TaxID=2886942 RepID=UPI001D0FB466|nr:methyltransferase [Hymenobacter sp. BT770]MCC3152407.1 methyltransferase [Hymenobacter sp. BT770]MDO3414617.1 methyltransferase [Hymenobacter sp. BT770]